MTTPHPPEAEAISQIRLRTFDNLRQAADALTLIQSPIGRPSSDPDIRVLIQERNTQIHQALTHGILTATQIALATGLTRQRVYAILQERIDTERQATYELSEAVRVYRAPGATADDLAQLLKVATNILKARALSMEKVAEQTGWSVQDLNRLLNGRAREALPAHTQLPETDV